jgi:hypothetical protein
LKLLSRDFYELRRVSAEKDAIIMVWIYRWRYSACEYTWMMLLFHY